MIDRLTEEQLVEIKKELARRDFFYFCVLMAPDFYKENRQYLIDFCRELQEFYFSDDDVLVINAPPRHGKSRTSQLFAEWLFGINPKIKVMTGSYNETLSTTFSKGVRNDIQALKGDKDKIIYSDIFPDTRIKRGDGAMNLWSLEGYYNNYLATSPTGTATGFGCNLLLIDDLIKNSEEAYNENTLDKHWEWFTNTMLSRLEEGGKIIIIMTRWSSKDLAGRALDYFSEIGMKVRHINLKAVQDDGTMLCEEILSKKSYELKVSAMGQDIASANYQQEPIDMKGRLYERFLTYNKLPVDDTGTPLFTAIKNYTDTADTGADYLCSICYGVYNKDIYILDVLYTKESMETTEIKTAELLYRNDIKRADIESNNGGRGFARNVKRILEEKYPDNTTVIKTFTQHKNKEARILTNSPYVMNHVFFPVGWENKWREFYKALYEYQREGKNKHDDACFVKGTMIATLTGNKPIEKVKKGEYVITPFGIRKVLENKMTGEKNVITNIGLTGTPNHKIFSKEGVFKELDTFTGVSECDIISGFVNLI